MSSNRYVVLTKCVCVSVVEEQKCLEIEVKTRSPSKLWQQTHPNLEIRFFSRNSPSSLSLLHPVVASSMQVAGELEGDEDLFLHLRQVVDVRGSILFFLLQLLLRRDPRMALLLKAPGTNTVCTLFVQQISRLKYYASPSLKARKSFFEAFFLLFFLDSW